MPVVISLDAMGGDHGVSVTIPAALSFRRRFPDVKLVLVGQQDVLHQSLLDNHGEVNDGLVIHHAEQVVAMDESVTHALRRKKDSSMRVAINLVKDGTANACVSAGNTGALVATARFVLKTLPGIDRPAIIGAMPTMNGHLRVLDMGANIDCTPEHLLQFGIMGSILVTALEGKTAPSIALLNIGEEEIKGNEVVKKAAELLHKSAINYVGFAEGNEIFLSDYDVIVCDGFMGNIALKTSEGLAQMITQMIRQEFNKNIITKMIGLVAMPVLKAFRRRVDHRRHNGATLIGLKGTVIKSHGGADKLAFEHAIEVALDEVQSNVPEKISAGLSKMSAEENQG
ncbi:MAG: phosphate acyltransferase PlsX [Acidiferrobacterales bacterium]